MSTTVAVKGRANRKVRPDIPAPVITQAQEEKALRGLVKAIVSTGNKYSEAVQKAIVAAIRYAERYGNCNYAADIVNAMPQSNRRALAIAHFAEYSPICVQKGEGGKYKAHLRKPYKDKAQNIKNDAYRPFNAAGAERVNWWQRPGAERVPDELTYGKFSEKMLAFFARADKQADKLANDDEKARAKALVRAAKAAIAAFGWDNAEAPGENWDEARPAIAA